MLAEFISREVKISSARSTIIFDENANCNKINQNSAHFANKLDPNTIMMRVRDICKLIARLVVLYTVFLPCQAIAWDPIKDLTGKSLHEHVPGVPDPSKIITGKTLPEHLEHLGGEIQNMPASLARCLSNPVVCTESEFKKIPYKFLWPIIERYKSHLFDQGSGRWRSLSNTFIEEAQQFYPEINLGSVRYAEDVDTLHGQAIAWHYHIFFPSTVDITQKSDMHLILHELEHVVQYERRGGEQAFISEYVLKTPGKIIERGNFNVHDYIDIERAADSKANQLIDYMYKVEGGRKFYVENDCYEPIEFALNFLVVNDDWQIWGWWSIDEKDGTYLKDVRSNNSIFYYHARSSSYTWSDDDLTKELHEEDVELRKTKLQVDKDGDWYLKLNCNQQ